MFARGGKGLLSTAIGVSGLIVGEDALGVGGIGPLRSIDHNRCVAVFSKIRFFVLLLVLYCVMILS